MVHHLAMRMRDFHALGYVHCDLKPGNVMWLPRENRWTVIDFGCASRTGEPARLGFSVGYAAPEVVSAYRRGAHTIVAQVWSLHHRPFWHSAAKGVDIEATGASALPNTCFRARFPT